MVSVTRRISEITQPAGGYIPPSLFEVVKLPRREELDWRENLPPFTIGLAVDYLSRFSMGSSPEKAFEISLMGANNVRKNKEAKERLLQVKDLGDTSIFHACQLTGYDVAYRRGPSFFKPVEDIRPDDITIQNIRTMVERSMEFFWEYGPVWEDGFTFPGGYTATVSTGDGDFLTADTLWDFKVSKYPPSKEHTLQLAMYYLMGLRSVHKKRFEELEYLGVYNPRLHTVYSIPIASIPKETFELIRRDVIGYA